MASGPASEVKALYSISPPLPAAPGPGAVEVYTTPLTVSETVLPALRQLLSDDERARADRFIDAHVGVRFTVGRAALRLLLGNRLSRPPESLDFDYGAKGKPALRHADLGFNVSHSGDLAVIAIAPQRAVGIDIERYRDDLDHLKLARRFFSDAERDDIDSLPLDQRQDAFYACWTRKEAYMKAVGDGFSIPLNAFRVSVPPDEPPALLHVRSDPEEPSRWTLRDLTVPAGYRACIAIQAPIESLDQFDLRWR